MRKKMSPQMDDYSLNGERYREIRIHLSRYAMTTLERHMRNQEGNGDYKKRDGCWTIPSLLLVVECRQHYHNHS